METLFVPLAVNNRTGKDAGMLERYDEPSFNFPVVRFFAPGGEELIPREDGVWSGGALTARLAAALNVAGTETPAWLWLAYEELRTEPLERAVFAMHCFWKGEAVLGIQPGVRGTRVGWLDGREVVEVRFDPQVLSYEALVGIANGLRCADRVYATTEEQLATAAESVGERARLERGSPRDAKPSDRKFHLQRSPLNVVPLTPLQATRANGMLEAGEDVRQILSPRQVALLERIEARLREDPEVLDGLQRPDEIRDLPAFAKKLEERLGITAARR